MVCGVFHGFCGNLFAGLWLKIANLEVLFGEPEWLLLESIKDECSSLMTFTNSLGDDFFGVNFGTRVRAIILDAGKLILFLSKVTVSCLFFFWPLSLPLGSKILFGDSRDIGGGEDPSFGLR